MLSRPRDAAKAQRGINKVKEKDRPASTHNKIQHAGPPKAVMQKIQNSKTLAVLLL